MNSMSVDNISILAGAVIVTLGAIVAQIMLAVPASELIMLG